MLDSKRTDGSERKSEYSTVLISRHYMGIVVVIRRSLPPPIPNQGWGQYSSNTFGGTVRGSYPMDLEDASRWIAIAVSFFFV